MNNYFFINNLPTKTQNPYDLQLLLAGHNSINNANHTTSVVEMIESSLWVHVAVVDKVLLHWIPPQDGRRVGESPAGCAKKKNKKKSWKKEFAKFPGGRAGIFLVINSNSLARSFT